MWRFYFLRQIITKFQKGNHNVLIATSIGEEGLDIGDVDLIICYDSSSSPIRMVCILFHFHAFHIYINLSLPRLIHLYFSFSL